MLSQGHNMFWVYNLLYVANKNHSQTLMLVIK